MLLTIDQRQTEIIREILESSVRELRFEAARADSREFRLRLAERERVVESVLAKISASEALANLA